MHRKRPRSSSLMYMLAQPEEKNARKFVVSPQGQYQQNPVTTPSFAESVAEMNVAVETPFKERSPDRVNRPCIQDAEGLKYRQIMSTACGDVYMQETPEKQTHQHSYPRGEVRFEGIPPINELRQQHPELFENLKIERFEFNITEEMIKNPPPRKRPSSQNKIMGCSAREMFSSFGMTIEKNLIKNLHKYFQFAHRQGHGFFGPPIKINFDPSTAGSNYSTLFMLEAPLRKLFFEDSITSVNVKGTVIFHPLLEQFPIEIQYAIAWGNGRTAVFSTYPLEYRRPTLAEHEIAFAVLKTVVTPEKTVEQSDAAFCDSDEPEASKEDSTAKQLFF